MRLSTKLVVVLGFCISALAASPALADPDALAKIVEGKCVPDQQTNGKPAPCVFVDLAGHAAVLKDLVGATQYLLIPTEKVDGLESPDLEKADAPNYFEAAWEARRFMEQSFGKPVPRDVVGLAINSVKGRTQNQFHIHVDCMRTDVLAALKTADASIGTAWAPLPSPLAGHPYQAMRIDGAGLSNVNPFTLLATGIPAASADMGDQTLVAVAATFGDGKDGFYLLTDHVDITHADLASGEELEDHDCSVLKQ